MEYLNKKAGDTLNFISKKTNNPAFLQIAKMKEKLENSEGLTSKDMFRLADLDGSGSLDMREFRLYFKKLGFIFSDHRVKEIFAYAK